MTTDTKIPFGLSRRGVLTGGAATVAAARAAFPGGAFAAGSGRKSQRRGWGS
jgi:nitrate/nitrite transport system substrate-binding protein